MAYVTERGKTFIVGWRDAESGKSRYYGVPYDKGPEPLTREEARARAEVVRQERERTERAGKRAFGRAIRSIGGPDPDPGPFAFGAYLRRMVADDHDLRDSTRELYTRNTRVHIEGTALARIDVRDVSPEDLSTFWRGLDVGTGARRNVYQLLSKVFNRAIAQGLLDVSPLKRAPEVRRPSKGRASEVVPLTVAQVEALAEAARSPRDRLEVLVMAYGGLRAGEVGGLRVQDIDFGRCQLRLRQQVARVTGKGQYISPLKTKAARRTVTVPWSITTELAAFLEATPAAADGRVFHGPNGELRAHNAVNHSVTAAARVAGIATHAHALRHTAVSLAIESGANPKAIQAFVGHSDIRETLQTYGHLFDYGGASIAEGFERLREAHRNGETAS